MNNIKETIAKNLKFFREERKITQKQLAEVLGVKHNTISTWENGTNSIDVSLLMQICEYLNVSLNDMFGRENRTSPERHSPFGTRKDDQLIKLWRKLPPEKQQKMLSIIELELEECASSEGQEGA